MPNVTSFNDRVDRCSDCNSFVKKGSSHTAADCARRIQNKKNRKPGTGKASARGKRVSPAQLAQRESALEELLDQLPKISIAGRRRYLKKILGVK